jgi:hypothetical protein
MGNSFKINALLVASALALSSATSLRGAITIFDNTHNDLSTRFAPPVTAGTTAEIGDEIVLAGTARWLTSFSFEYFGTNTASATSFSGNVEARVRFYQNDGAPFHGYATPSTLFYDSGFFSLNLLGGPTPRSTLNFQQGVDFPTGGLHIPTSDMTWTVQFTGMGATDSVGVDLYSPPTIGQDFPDYWSNSGGWQLLTNSIPMDFAAQFNAEMTSPEPSVLALSVVGGLGILAFGSRLRRKE